MYILKTFDNYFTANIWKKKFELEGIDCFLKDEFTITIDPILTNALGGIKIVAINEKQYDKAIELLKEFEEEYRDNLICPKCGAKGMLYIGKQNSKNILLGIASWLFISYAKPIDYIYYCNECKYEAEKID